MQGTIPISLARERLSQGRVLHLAADLRVVVAWAALTALGLCVALAGISTALDLVHNAPRLGIIATSDGRVVAIDPDGPAIRAGVQLGDTITAINGQALLRAGFSTLNAPSPDGFVALTEGGPGTYRLFRVPMIGPSKTALAGDVAALAAALALWLSGLVVGLVRRRDSAARLYVLAAFSLALALCALVARDGSHLWPWPVLVPAIVLGLGALLLSQLALAGPPGWVATTSVVVITIVPGVLGALGAMTMLASPVALLVAVPTSLLAFAVVGAPLVAHLRTASEPHRRRLRVALVAAVAGLVPAYLWLGLGGAIGYPVGPVVPWPGVHVSVLWSTSGLPLLALLYGALFVMPRSRRLDEYTRTGASYLVALAILSSGPWAASALSGAAQLAALAAAAVVFLPLQRGIERLFAHAVWRPHPDYAGALQTVESLTAVATSPGELASRVAGVLPGLLSVRTALILLRGLDCPPDDYRLFSPMGPGDVVPCDPALEARALDATDAVALDAAADRPALAQAMQRFGAALWVPLWWDGAQRGVLALGPREGDDPYEASDLRQIAGLSGLLSLSLNAQELIGHLSERTTALVALTHRLSHAHEQERASLSRELHDVVAQELIALTRQLRRYGDGTVPPPAIWSDMLAAAQDALTATRRICNGLRPAILDLGLVPALRDLVTTTQDRDGAPDVSLTIEGAERRFTSDVEFALFRVAQEGLSNALAHASARQIRVEVCFNSGTYLRIRDDGRGFTVPQRFEDLPGDHLGLIGMRERLGEFGATLTVTSRRGQGTVMQAHVPAGDV